MPKIVFIGAGSVVFARNLLADIFAHASLANSRLELVDTDPERLQTAELLAHSLRESLGASAEIRASAERRKALDGADFVIAAFGVGGYAATELDIRIPQTFGVHQIVGDTLGPGGIFRSLRSVPVLLDICRDMEALCPEALLLNYCNPMATHCLAVARATKIRYVGLCHGVANTARAMRMYLELAKQPAREIRQHFNLPIPQRARQWQEWWQLGLDPRLNYTCAGINHMSWFLRFESAGRDLYPEFARLLQMPHMLRLDPVRFELYRHMGYFMAETSGHTSEYLPYFLKTRALMKEMHLRQGLYLQTCRNQTRSYRQMRRDLLAGRPVIATPYHLSVEYASRILNAIVTKGSYAFNGNVRNDGGRVISNLPGDSCVEVPCVADGTGIRPAFSGALPPQCAALNRSNINVQDLVAHAVLENNPQHVCHAMQVDPNTASVLTLAEIAQLTTAMLDAQQAWLPKAFRQRPRPRTRTAQSVSSLTSEVR